MEEIDEAISNMTSGDLDSQKEALEKMKNELEMKVDRIQKTMEIQKVEIFEGKLDVSKIVDTKELMDDYIKILNGVFDYYP